MATQTSAVAAEFIYDTGEEVLPLGGCTGTIPSPTASATAALVAAKQFHLALVASPVPRRARPGWWPTASTCRRMPRHRGRRRRLKIYYCLPKPAARSLSIPSRR